MEKLGFKDLGVSLRCIKCGVPLNTVEYTDYKIQNNENSNLHVCDPIKEKAFKKSEKKAINDMVIDAKKQQTDILKAKDIDESQLRKPMTI